MRKLNILYVTTVSITMGFFPEHIKMLQNAGHTVELACNLDSPLPEKVSALGCDVHHVPFSRSPFSKDNLAAYRELKELLAENHYDIVHTHTPNASALVRLACRKLRKSGTKVFYTAHGFHFYTGAPLKNWLVYYPVERFLSRWTDVLITMNQEDYRRAGKFHAGRTELVHGVGVDISRFDLRWTGEQKKAKRQELGVNEGDCMLLSVGELIPRKNHETVIRAIAELNDTTIQYFICGDGPLRGHLEQLIRSLGLDGHMTLLGIRRDIGELNQAADLFLLPSFHEGLPVALMEAMAAGNPVICSRIRGNVDLIEENKGGILCKTAQIEDYSAAIRALADNVQLRTELGVHNQECVWNFCTEQVLAEMKQIYGIEQEVDAECASSM